MQRPFPAYDGPEPYVFVCYAHDDQALVYPEITRLNESGVNIWYDEGISPGSEWSDFIARHITGAAVFLYFVTPRSVESQHCRSEVNFALEEQRAILAVHLEPTDVPPGLRLSLNARQAILKYEHADAAYAAKLANAIRHTGTEGAAEPSAPSTLRLGEWTLDVATQRLHRGDEEHTLDPKAQSVLLHLVDRAPDVVSREGLVARTWPGVVVGDNVLDQAITQLRRAFGDDPRQPTYIETLPKRGYRLLVSTDRPEAPARAQTTPATTPIGHRTASRYVTAAVATLLLGFGVAYWMADPHGSPPEEAVQPPSVSVHPFGTIGDDPQLAQFAEVVTQDVSARLAETAVRVVSFEAEGQPASSYSLGGTVRRLTDAIRISVELRRTRDGYLAWSKSLDEPGDIARIGEFEKAPFVARMIENTILTTISLVDSLPIANQQARDEYLAARIEFSEISLGSGGDWRVLLNHYRRTAELDPAFFMLPFDMAIAYANRLGGTILAKEALPEAHGHLDRLDTLAPGSWLAAYARGQVNIDLEFAFESAVSNIKQARRLGAPSGVVEEQLCRARFGQGRMDEAIRHCQAAVSGGALMDQASALFWLSMSLASAGRYREALASIDAAIATTGHPPLQVLDLRTLVLSRLGDRTRADENLDRALEFYGDSHYEVFARVLAVLGRTDAARASLQQAESEYRRNALFFFGPTFEGHRELGNVDEAFVWLDRAIENREWVFIGQLRAAQDLGAFGSDPRFAQAMNRVDEIGAGVHPRGPASGLTSNE